MNTRFLLNKLFPVWIVFTLLLTLTVVRASPEDEYVSIFDIVSQADTLIDQGKTNLANAKYIQAQNALVTFQRANPRWNTKMVTYRMTYLAEKIAATSEKIVIPETSAPTAAKTSAAAAPSQVKLLEAGAEPRSELRYHPGVGVKRSVKLGLKIGVNMTATGQEATAMNSPMIEMGMETEVKSIAPDGNITFTMHISDINIAEDTNATPLIVQTVKSSFAGVKGMTTTTTMTDHGVTKSFNMKAPANAGADAKQMVEQMKESFSDLSSPLPNEPIGIGAKWELTKQVESDGLPINQVETYELVSKEGEVVSIHMTLVETAGKQKNQNASLLGMGQVSGSGEGSFLQDLSQIMPTSGHASEMTEINMKMDVGVNGQQQSMKMKMTTEATFKSN